MTHTFLPPTLIYMLLGHPALDDTESDFAAVLLVRRGADVGGPAGGGHRVIGPVMAQLFGQTEAPMMISMLPPAEHFRADGSVAHRAARVGRAAGAAGDGRDHGRRRAAAAAGERGEIVVRGSLVMAGLLQEPASHRGGVARSAGTTPATSATSTRTTTCSSSTGPRT